MPLPTESTGDISLEVCCDSFYEVAEALLDSAYEALADCLGDACKDVAHFVSVNEPTYTNDGNYIAVWLVNLEPTRGPRGTTGSFMPRPRAKFGFKLMETGYPTLESTAAKITVPDGERIHAIAKHSYSHIEKVIRSVYDDFRSRTLPSGCVCGGAVMGQLRPTARSGGLVGWVWDITLDVCW